MARSGAERAKAYRERHKPSKKWTVKIGRLAITFEWLAKNAANAPKGRPVRSAGVKWANTRGLTDETAEPSIGAGIFKGAQTP